jgi:hypothetical protein
MEFRYGLPERRLRICTPLTAARAPRVFAPDELFRFGIEEEYFLSGIWKHSDPDVKVLDFSYESDVMAQLVVDAWSDNTLKTTSRNGQIADVRHAEWNLAVLSQPANCAARPILSH